jgi:ribonuclease HI
MSGELTHATIQLYTDGASTPRAEVVPGGWAYAYVYNNMLICTGWDGEKPTTNQRMELMGVIRGLEDRIHRHELDSIHYDAIEIITDSAYVYRGMVEKWYIDWRFNDWTKRDDSGKLVPIANKDLWQRLISAEQCAKDNNITILWTKIRGHKGVLYNEVCDKLAVKGKLSVS